MCTYLVDWLTINLAGVILADLSLANHFHGDWHEDTTLALLLVLITIGVPVLHHRVVLGTPTHSVSAERVAAKESSATHVSTVVVVVVVVTEKPLISVSKL